jgi:hypothetical protein
MPPYLFLLLLPHSGGIVIELLNGILSVLCHFLFIRLLPVNSATRRYDGQQHAGFTLCQGLRRVTQ